MDRIATELRLTKMIASHWWDAYSHILIPHIMLQLLPQVHLCGEVLDVFGR